MRTIVGTGCSRRKIVCSTLYYKELKPRVQVTLCESVEVKDEAQRTSEIKNINKQRTI